MSSETKVGEDKMAPLVLVRMKAKTKRIETDFIDE